MKFKVNSWHARFYNHAYNIKPVYDVSNGCTYFTKVTWALLTYPLYCIGFLFYWIFSSETKRKYARPSMSEGFWLQIFIFLHIFVFTMVGYGVLTNETSLEISGLLFWIASFFAGLAIMVIAIMAGGVVVAIVLGIGSLFKRRNDDGFFTSAYKSWKNKHCPIIEWVDEEDKK